jgi:hypothetical protein
MKRLGNYIRDETNKLSSSLDMYMAPNDTTNKQDDSWIEQQKKGAAKSITTSNNDGIIESSNSFEVLSGSEETDMVIDKGAPTSGNDVRLTASQAEDQYASSAAEKSKSPLRKKQKNNWFEMSDETEDEMIAAAIASNAYYEQHQTNGETARAAIASDKYYEDCQTSGDIVSADHYSSQENTSGGNNSSQDSQHSGSSRGYHRFSSGKNSSQGL